jgi:hypothetical protein
LRLWQLCGTSLPASRTTTGRISFPIPYPWKSAWMATWACVPSCRGSTVTVMFARIGPSIPWMAHLLGGLSSVISDVEVRSEPPIRRVMMHSDPTA